MFEEDFVTSKNGRTSNVHCGRYVSYSAHLENKDMCEKLISAIPEAIGGDMEGGELLRFQQKRKIEGMIVIKGVVGYADGSEYKVWHFTAALAALMYAQSKLYYYKCQKALPSVSSKHTSVTLHFYHCVHWHANKRSTC